ncbi:MAG TPA: hypothetical protein VFK61_00715 [Candidatus Limnocylindria bacterium]|jgi:hypothetical protein|nr:hypothetical protein [Candidatus Limnocylindria bacterium]
MPAITSIGLVVAGALLLGGLLAIRLSGASPGIARRLAGARPLRIGDVLDLEEPPTRPVRVSGRIRCPDPIVTERGDRLVAVHRDVQVKPHRGGWRSIERIRETRGFELWDHSGALPIDPAQAAEPLVVIPHVWRGTTADLTDAGHLAAVARLGVGSDPWPARSVTRMVSVVERLLVLADVRRDADGVHLAPPPGGFLMSTLELDDAMRLLGGPRRRLLLAGYGLLAASGVAALVAVAGIFIGS